MKRRANLEGQTLENIIAINVQEALQGINQLKTSITDLKVKLNSFSKNNGLSNFNKQIKQSSGIANAIKKTINFSAIYLGAKQTLSTLKEMTNESIKYTETVNLFNVSMGKGLEGLNQYYEKAIDFQERLEEKLGVNIEESMRYQALFNSMTKSMGLSADYAYILSENMTKLGYDLASLYNIDTENAMTKLRAGLAGQTEPLRELGLDITEQSLRPIAQSLGITESIRNMSQAEKTVLRYIAVLKQAQVAQGDFARTMESPANQLRIFNAQVTAFKRNMGNLWQGILGGILPYVNAVMMVINELLKMVAKLFGFEVFEQPVNISSSVGTDDLADDLGTASKKAKELKSQLMGFDEINNISLDTDSKKGSSGSTSNAGIDQRLLDALKGYDNLMDSVSNKATEIRDKMLDWLGFERDDNGTWKLKEGLTNFEKILDVAKLIGVAIGTWKISSTITSLLKNLGILKGKQNFQLAFGLTLLATGIFAQYKGTKHLLDGNIDLFTLLETFLGTTGGALGIVNLLKATKLGKSLSLGNKLKVGFGLMLGIQGVQVFLDGINTGDIKKIILGALEGVLSLSVAINGLFGVNIIQNIRNATLGMTGFSAAVSASTGVVGKHAATVATAGSTMSGFALKAGTVVAGLAGITAGSALSYATMKDFTTGTIGTIEAIGKLTAGLGLATASGVLAGSQFGTVGMVIGGIAGFTTSAITAFMGYKDGIESLNIPTTTLTDDIKSLTEEIDSNRKAHEETVKSIKDTYEEQLVEAEYANRLSQQLQGLVDVNGRVKEGNEERVNFILGELNSALGTEYELNSNIITKNGEVVDSYSKLQESIASMIETKKKEAEQTAITELYKESIKEQIKLDRDRIKSKEIMAKAEKEYNDLIAKDLGPWTMSHNESCKQIIQNYIDASDQYSKTVADWEKGIEETNYYSQKLTDNIIADTGTLSQEMVTQQQISTGKLQEIVNTSTEQWEKAYNELDDIQKTSMLAQSTTIDNWSPILQQKWSDMAKNSSENFLTAISQVEPKTQSKILSTISVTETLTPEMVNAWKNLAQKSKDDFDQALSSLPEETRLLIETLTSNVESLSPEQIQRWADLAKNDKYAYEKALSGLDETTRQRMQSCVDAINNHEWTAEEAARGLGYAVKQGIGSIDTTEEGKQIVNGVAQGIRENKNNFNIRDAVSQVTTGIVGLFRKDLVIRSPSKLMKSMVGKYIPLGVAEGIKEESKSVFSSIDNLNEGIKVRASDFTIDTNQFVDFNEITGNVSTQSQVDVDSNITDKIANACYNAFVSAMRTQGIRADINVKPDKDGIFKAVQAGAESYAIQTGESPFPVLA